MGNKSKHTASASSYGYLYQPHRALLRLAQAKNKSLIGVEALDDVSKVSFDKIESGKPINSTVSLLEQDKTSLSKTGSPFGDRSHSLWNTLYIWVKEYEKGTFDINEIELALVTNRKIPPHYLVKKLSESSEDKEVETIINKLFHNIKLPAKKVKNQVKYLKKRQNHLMVLIPKIILLDQLDLARCDKLIKEELHLIPEVEYQILNLLKGWVIEQTIKKWENDEPAFISKSAFNRYLHNMKIKVNTDRITERSKNVVESDIPENQIQATKDELFVEQLEAITDKQEDDLILQAVTEYLCTDVERTRLVRRGEVLEEDFNAFDQECQNRWKQVFRRYKRDIQKAKSPQENKDIGYKIYDDTTFDWCCPLRGVRTTESYFTKGAFHILASKPKIGWHPKWEEKFKK